MAPTYKQMNGSQRASRKALIGQVSNLLVKRKNAGVGQMPKTVAFGNKQVAMRPAQTPNYRGLGAANAAKGREKFARKGRRASPFRVPTF